MGKAGFGWSGRIRRQRFKCYGCGGTNIKKNGNGSSPEAIPDLATGQVAPQEVTFPRAGGEDTFLDKPLRICPADSNPDINARGCAFHLNGRCNRFSYPFGCRLGLSEEEWEALPTG